MTSDLTLDIQFNDHLAAAARAAAAALRGFYEKLVEWALCAARALAVLVEGVLKVLGVFRRHEVALVAVSSGWRGLSLRHALRPPTRGYWIKRCACQACGMRAFMR